MLGGCGELSRAYAKLPMIFLGRYDQHDSSLDFQATLDLQVFTSTTYHVDTQVRFSIQSLRSDRWRSVNPELSTVCKGDTAICEFPKTRGPDTEPKWYGTYYKDTQETILNLYKQPYAL